MLKTQPVYVSWSDAVSQDEWVELDEAKKLKPHAISTLGWLIHEDKDCVIVCLNIDLHRPGSSQMISIPRAWIHKMTKLKIKI